MANVHYLTIPPERADQRIDNFLFNQFRALPKSRIYRALRGGEVRVNKKRVKALYKLKSGDVVRIPPFQIDAVDKKVRVLTAQQLTAIKQTIVYQDERLLLINKPPGLAVHGGTGVYDGLINRLRALPGAQSWQLAHRLDLATSGCLLVAKEYQTLRHIQQAMQQGELDKHYWTLLKGQLNKERLVDLPLLKYQLQGGERMVVVDKEQGKPAKTRFVPVKQFQAATLVRAELITGRTHQIRVHAQAINHPIGGDQKYGDKKFNLMLKEAGLTRLFLHALSIAGKINGQPFGCCVPLPDSLLMALGRLEIDSRCRFGKKSLE